MVGEEGKGFGYPFGHECRTDPDRIGMHRWRQMVHQNKRPTIPTSASSLVAQSRTECSIPDLQSLCRDEAVAMISGEAFENRRRQGLCAIRLAPLILAAQTPSRSQNKDPQLESKKDHHGAWGMATWRRSRVSHARPRVDKM